jgi:hypothetical protein
MTHEPTRPGRPLEPATAACAAMYLADLIPAYAFVFRLPSTDTRFTVYTADPDRYLIGATYILALAEPGERQLSLDPEDWELLAHCLELVAERWAEAVEQTDAAAVAQPETDLATEHETQGHAPAQPEKSDTVTVEPSPTGYQHMSRLFRDELDRVQRLRRRIGPLLHPTDEAESTGVEGEPS